jgi:hypothetical protein
MYEARTLLSPTQTHIIELCDFLKLLAGSVCLYPCRVRICASYAS